MSDQAITPSVITREFDAPRVLVFDAWTKTEHLVHWMFPMPGCSCDFADADIREGGRSLHRVTMPNGYQMWLLTQYEKIHAPETLVFLQYISNEQGDIVPNPHIPNWPEHMLATLTFEETDSGTKLTFAWEPRDATAEELAVFEATRADHNKGWGAGLDQLQAYLSTL